MPASTPCAASWNKLVQNRRGVDTGCLIRHLQTLAAQRGAWVVFVQADHGDGPTVALYTKPGTREGVVHFDLPVPGA